MNIGDVCTRDVYTARRDESLADAAREMRKRRIGALVVVETDDDLARAVGIVTDRDVVCGQVNRAADLFCLTVGDVMTADPLTLSETSGIAEAIGRMSDRGVRRAPVVNKAGNMVGVVSVDDLLLVIAAELGALSQLLSTQSRRERAFSRTQAR